MTTRAYYNELDPFAAAWLRELIKARAIAPGDVDERDIREVQPGDLKGYAQCHFFAGIGGWSQGLRLAGWEDSRPVWTGSCPCQGFSSAGKGAGFRDPRHLWPRWFELIRECRPPVVFGEQVAAAIRHGWWDLVQRDLEGEGYACGMAVLGAHSVGAPHIRQRLWFVADTTGSGRQHEQSARPGISGAQIDSEKQVLKPGTDCIPEFVAQSMRATGEWRTGSVLGTQAQVGGTRIEDGCVADGLTNGGEDGSSVAESTSERLGEARASSGRSEEWIGDSGEYDSVADAEHSIGRAELAQHSDPYGRNGLGRSGDPRELADAPDLRCLERRDSEGVALQGKRSIGSGEHPRPQHTGELSRGLEGLCGDGDGGMDDPQRGEEHSPTAGGLYSLPGGAGADGGMGKSDCSRSFPRNETTASARHRDSIDATSFWNDCAWLPCRDNKLRPVEPSIFPLAHGIPNRVGLLRGAGNAIVPQTAQAFIEAWMEHSRESIAGTDHSPATPRVVDGK